MKVIITGTTGMVGEGVLLECLQNNKVSEVLSISRKPCGIKNQKLTELLVADFFEIENYAENLKGYDACFYCAGKSSAGMTEAEYTKLTFDMTIHFANVLKELNPNITFNFVSGYHTDTSEKGSIMWARVKGKTENGLTKIFSEKAYYFRPALMKPTKGQQNFYGYNGIAHKVFYPVLGIFYPACTIEEIGKAMINTATYGYSKNILEVKDIKEAAE
ncbi:NAD-dependent epimerase/dehydratase family protein [Sinomicrobium sp. M5D2P17]